MSTDPLRTHVEQLIADLDAARTEGRVWTYGLVQERLREGLERYPATPIVAGRDTIAKAIEDRIKESPILPEIPGQLGRPLDATMHDLADAVLAVLPGRTEAQVMAPAFDLGVRAAADAIFGPEDEPRPGVPQLTWRTPDNPYRSDELERGDGR